MEHMITVDTIVLVTVDKINVLRWSEKASSVLPNWMPVHPIKLPYLYYETN